MVVAEFKGNETSKYVGDVYQYDLGQILCIKGLNLPKFVEIDFALQETGSTTESEVGITKNGVTEVEIPNHMLMNNDIGTNYMIYAFVYLTDGTSGETIRKIRISVKARSKPENFTVPEDTKLFQEAIKAVNESAERAETAEQQSAKHAEQTKADAIKTGEDRTAIEEMVDSVSGISEQVQAVKDYKEQAQTAATNALLSEQASEQAKESAIQAQANAETAEGMAEQHALEVAGDKTEVERLATQVIQDKASVEQTKTVVDKTAQDFALIAQQAVADVNNAGQSQTERVQTAGTTAVENIKTAQGTATGAVEIAKTEAINVIQAEGATQIGNVTAEGTKQVQAVQNAAQEIIADREQIQTNKTDIAELRQTKADAIIETASGTLLNIKDSANAYFEDFSMFGKTEQANTTGANIFDDKQLLDENNPNYDKTLANTGISPIVSAGEKGSIKVVVTGKNLINAVVERGSYSANSLDKVNSDSTRCRVSETVYINKGFVGTLSTSGEFQIYTRAFKGTNLVAESGAFNEYFSVNNSNNAFDCLTIVIRKKDNSKIDDIEIKSIKIQLEHGSSATNYEPYREPQIITLQLDSPLTKWDKIEKRDGVWGIVRKSLREELTYYDFKEYVLASGSYPAGTYCYAIKMPEAVLSNQSSFCTHFKNSDYAYLAMNAKVGIYSDHNNVKYKYFVSDKQTVEEFKAWLKQQKEAGTPVELVYKTAEETWEPLPEETQLALNALHTNYPTTVVNNSEDAEMKLNYVADTKNYYLNREQAIRKQILDIQNALISQKISGGGYKGN